MSLVKFNLLTYCRRLRSALVWMCFISTFGLSGCNSGSLSSTATQSGNQTLTLNRYIYSQANTSATIGGGTDVTRITTQSGGNTYQQTINVVTESANITSIVVDFYSVASCGGSLLQVVNMLPNSGSSTNLPVGTYFTTNAGNYALCSSFAGGCTVESSNVHSMLYIYNYTSAGVSGSESASICISNPSNSPAGDKLANWTSGAACTSGSIACGYSESYSITIAPLTDTFTATILPFGGFSGSGNGESTTTPFQVAPSTNGTLNVIYTNTGKSTATGFTTTASSLPSGWSLVTHQCTGFTLAIGASCTDSYQLNSSTAGYNNLNFNTITASWTDASGSHSNQTILPTNYTAGIAYAYIYSVTVVFSSSPTGSPVISGTNINSNGTPFYVVFTLNSILAISSSQTFKETNAGSTGIATNLTCSMGTAPSSSCSISLTSPNPPSTAPSIQPLSVVFTFANNTSGQIAPSPTSASLNLTFKYIGITSTASSGSFGESGATSQCVAAFGTGYVAVLGTTSPSTINGLESNTTYYSKSNIAAAPKLVGTTNASANFTGILTNAISNTSASAWTGLNASSTPWSVISNCSNWSSSSGSGAVGAANSTGVANAFGNGSTLTCSTTGASLYCAQQ